MMYKFYILCHVVSLKGKLTISFHLVKVIASVAGKSKGRDACLAGTYFCIKDVFVKWVKLLCCVHSFDLC